MPPPNVRIIFLDVGQGDGTFIVTGTPPKTILIDFGERGSKFKIAAQDAMALLQDEIGRISHARNPAHPPPPTIDHLFLTHGDADHISYIERLTRGPFTDYPAGATLVFGEITYGGRAADYRGLIGKLVADAKNWLPDNCASDPFLNPVPYRTVGDTAIYVLGANFPTKKFDDKNTKSLVLKLVARNGRSVVFCGDAPIPTETNIIATYQNNPGFLRADAMKLGHHGSHESSGVNWINAVRPGSIFASGDVRWAHPYCKAICRFFRANVLANKPNTPAILKGPLRMVCGDGHKDNRTYYNNSIKKSVFVNLWFQVPEGPSMVMNVEVEPGQPKRQEVVGPGLTYGIAWAMDITGSVEFSRTLSANPDAGQGLGESWDCATDKPRAAALATPLLAAPRDPALVPLPFLHARRR